MNRAVAIASRGRVAVEARSGDIRHHGGQASHTRPVEGSPRGPRLARGYISADGTKTWSLNSRSPGFRSKSGSTTLCVGDMRG